MYVLLSSSLLCLLISHCLYQSKEVEHKGVL